MSDIRDYLAAVNRKSAELDRMAAHATPCTKTVERSVPPDLRVRLYEAALASIAAGEDDDPALVALTILQTCLPKHYVDHLLKQARA